MNQFRLILAAGAAMTALAIAVPSAAHPEGDGTKQEVREIKIIKSEGDGKKVVIEGDDKEFAANCGEGRKFESSSNTGDAKKKSVSKIVICSDPGESDEAWAKTLKETLARVESDSNIPAEGKTQIIADLKSELAKLNK